MHRGLRYRLYPTPAQAETLRQWIGAVRFIYNLAFEQRRDFWRQYRQQTGSTLTWAAQSREVSELRTQVGWLADVPRAPLEQALRDLDWAFRGFFAGRSRYPSARRKGVHDTAWFNAQGLQFRRLNVKWSAIRLPKLGWVKFRDTRPAVGKLFNVTVSARGDKWFISVTRDVEVAAEEPRAEAVGIDRGIVQTLTLSTGEHIQAPNMVALRRAMRKAQRALARRKRGSGRYARQKARVGAIAAGAAAKRTDWAHRTSTNIARRFGLVGIEDLKIENMTASAAGRGRAAKAGLNRSILEQCWGKFARFLDYKLTERGGMLISVPAAYTSQTCAGCGAVDARSRKSQAVFACVHCGHEDNADVNAAKEILRRSTALLGVEGSHWRPVEASIMAAA